MFNIFKRNKKKVTELEVPIYGDALTFGSLFKNQQSAMNISSAYRAVSMISDSIAILPITVKKQDNNIVNHNLNVVFKNNLHYLSKFNFMKMLIQSVLLKGNGFAYIERAEDGTVVSLRYLKDVSIIYNDSDKKPTLYYVSPSVSSSKIEPCNMIHLVKNSNDGVNGISQITYASRTLKNANYTENSASNFFENGMNLSGVLTVEGQLSAAQKEQIRSSWSKAYAQGGNGLAVLQGNMKYEPIQLNSKDSQLLESRQFNVSDVARFFEISPILLGDLSHSSYNSIEQAQTDFLLHTLQPYISMVENEFSRKLLKPSEQNKGLTVNLEESYILRTDSVSKSNYYSTLLNNGILSINEVRKELGYTPIENGDKHFVAYTDINQNTIDDNKNKDEKPIKDEENL